MSVSRNGNGSIETGEYLDTEVLVWSNTWDASGNHNYDSVDGRDAIKTVSLERPDDHLIELKGFEVAVGDPVEGAVGAAKWDFFVRNDADPPTSDTGWPNFGLHEDDLIFTAHGQKEGDGGMAWHDSGFFAFPEPVLSTGKLGILQRTSPNETGGELALTAHYTYREVDQDTLTTHILNRE